MRSSSAIIVGVAVTIALAGYHAMNPLRGEHLLAIGLFVALGALRPTRRVAAFVFPLLLLIFVFDLLRFFADGALERVSLTLVPAMEAALFGVERGGQLLLPNDYVGALASLPLDLLGALIYATHTAGVFGLVGWLAWRNLRRGDGEAGRRLVVLTWGFLLMNLLAFAVQVAWPVAPPWYLDLHGATPPDAPVIGNAAALLRVDRWLGFDYFAGIYARGPYVFGAMPSLHVAFPTWFALNLRGSLPRIFGWAWVVVMSFYAVYLNHHFVLDVIVGAALPLATWALMQRTRLGAFPRAAHAFVVDALAVGPDPQAEDPAGEEEVRRV